MSPDELDPFWLRTALGHPQTCDEEVSRGGEVQPCEKIAVALRMDPDGDESPYPVCAYHARADMVPLEMIVRNLVDRIAGQEDFHRGFLAKYGPQTSGSES